MTFNPDKTEIMLFTNLEHPEINFTFEDNIISTIESHRHLGVTFSTDAKWNAHIENIVSSVSKHINILRKLKFKINRSNLEKLYLVYIRPIFEYASEVWDNCGSVNASKLERLQLEAARIVTGLPVFANSNFIFRELGWETLQERRTRRKLQLFYNIQNNNAPGYLSNLIPPTIQSTTVYQLRNGEDIIIPFCRLSITNDSYIPSTIRQWNNLDLSIRNVGSMPHFKSELKKLSNSYSVNIPKYYSYGPRKLNIVLTQFRCSATFLNYDLFKVNIISNPSCSCGAIREDSYHYFFECPLYNGIRNDLLNCLDWLPNDCHLDLNLLIFGNSTLTNEQNELVLKKVFDYIRKSERFLIVQCTFNVGFFSTNPHPFNHCIVINVINVLYYSYSPFNLFLSLKFLLFLLSFLLSNFGINV